MNSKNREEICAEKSQNLLLSIILKRIRGEEAESHYPVELSFKTLTNMKIESDLKNSLITEIGSLEKSAFISEKHSLQKDRIITASLSVLFFNLY